MHPTITCNKAIRAKPETSFARVSETMKQTNEAAKDTKVKGGRTQLKLRCNQNDKRAMFRKEKSDSLRSLRRIKRRLFLEAVKSAPSKQHPSTSVPGKKNRTGHE